jgi:predicted DNA-binding protein with PD1-like motif
VSKLAAVHGNRVIALKLGKSQGWVSKMRTIAKAVVLPKSVAGSLVLVGGVRDVEIAYYVTLIERESRQKAREVAANIANETRQSVKRTYTQLRSSR